ncbi:hypothetical protein PICMEDRAFT_17730 [Pichia membranifaciens NRRL Y-2026]|uniref:DUF676 domain-containing protein n=1 Tax=Pichia membranifaciens NRRL Y-2026 TaxID=763406 RepID=A0A1E3NGJ9_9ASCO|nr:hypothetical protein PICMEDRAFT_17730 [Pichia membranifaciens NRRL Y-2026]ODQ45239.1 hypothetical protein PICMEDRAFT_17730 [Pichia membranifaciens NRRL Y-2026]
MSSPPVSQLQECHLIVLSHGLWGTSDHFSYLEELLQESLAAAYPEKRFAIYKTKSNEKFKTYDGIDLCGARVVDEILEETAQLRTRDGLLVTEFSLIGYSLGGLIARFAIGMLTYRKYFESISPINFVTFCSPHVGVLTPGDSLSIKCFNNMVPYLLGNSGKHMFLKDAVHLEHSDEKVPLLKLMATENSIFVQGLKKFKYRSLYSNIRADIRTSWWSSGISYINPFEILDKNPEVLIDHDGFINFANGSKFELSFLDAFAPIILDVNKPIKFTGLINYENEKKLAKYAQVAKQEEDYLKNFFYRKLKWLILLFNTFIYVPMWMTWFVLFNVLQLFTSFFRVTRESSRLKDNFCIYNIVDQVATTVSNAIPIHSASSTPLLKPTLSRSLSEGYSNELNKLENDLHDQGDFFLDSVFDAITSSNNMNQSIFNQQSQGDKTLVTSISKLCSIPIDDITDWESDYKLLGKTKKEAFEYYQVLESFRLNMSPHQREIIKNLNQLEWSKYPIYITKTNATHAAAIVRHEDPTFEEGKTVIRHFCEQVFKLD